MMSEKKPEKHDADTAYDALKKIFDWDNNKEWQDLFTDHEAAHQKSLGSIKYPTVGASREKIVEAAQQYIETYDDHLIGTATSASGKEYRKKISKGKAETFLKEYLNNLLKRNVVGSEDEMYGLLQREGMNSFFNFYQNIKVGEDRELYSAYHLKRHILDNDFDFSKSIADKLVKEDTNFTEKDKVNIIKNPINYMKSHFERKYQRSGDTEKDYRKAA